MLCEVEKSKVIQRSWSLRRFFEVLFLLSLSLFASEAIAKKKLVSFALATKPSRAAFSILDAQGKVILLGKTPYVGSLPAGKYRLTIKKTNYFPEARTIILVTGEQKVIQIPLLRKKEGKLIPSTRQSIAPNPRERASTLVVKRSKSKSRKIASTQGKMLKKKRTIPWLPLIGGAMLVGVGSIFYGLGETALSKSKDHSQTQIAAFLSYRRAESSRTTSGFLLIGGGAMLGVAAFLFFWESKDGKKLKRQSIPMIGEQGQSLLPTVALHRD